MAVKQFLLLLLISEQPIENAICQEMGKRTTHLHLILFILSCRKRRQTCWWCLEMQIKYFAADISDKW